MNLYRSLSSPLQRILRNARCQRTSSFPSEALAFRTVVLQTSNLVNLLQCVIDLNNDGGRPLWISYTWHCHRICVLSSHLLFCVPPLTAYLGLPKGSGTDGSSAKFILWENPNQPTYLFAPYCLTNTYVCVTHHTNTRTHAHTLIWGYVILNVKWSVLHIYKSRARKWQIIPPIQHGAPQSGNFTLINTHTLYYNCILYYI